MHTIQVLTNGVVIHMLTGSHGMTMNGLDMMKMNGGMTMIQKLRSQLRKTAAIQLNNSSKKHMRWPERRTRP